MAFDLKRRDFLLAMGAGPGLASAMGVGVIPGVEGPKGGGNSNWGGMQIQGVVDERKRVVVETTGAVFAIYRSDPARIEITQKINGPRGLCVIDLHTSFESLSLDFHDKDDCILYVPGEDFGFNIRVFSDSLLSIRVGPRVVKISRPSKDFDSGSANLRYENEVRIEARGDWMPDYSYSEEGNLLFLDKTGGYGQYLIPSAPPFGGLFEKPAPGVSFSAHGWETYATLSTRKVMLACVAPPRSFDWRKSFEERIVFNNIASKRANGTWNGFPSDSQLQEYARYGNILELHYWARGAGPMRGAVANRVDIYTKAAPWAAWHYEPLDATELARVVSTAHRLGMRVLPYTSPLFFPGNAREFLREIERLLETYNFDGVYFDGVSEDIGEAYEIMKGTRRLLGPNRRLFVHIPSPILGTSYPLGKYVYCPFIDTYADYILRQEHIDNFDNNVLQYTISAYNISNTIGFVCNYDYDLQFNRQLILKALEYNVRVPYWVGWDIYLKERGKELGTTYPTMAEFHEIMRDSYFPALDRLQRKQLGHSG